MLDYWIVQSSYMIETEIDSFYYLKLKLFGNLFVTVKLEVLGNFLLDIFVADVKCQPELPTSLAVCLSNGHVLLLHLVSNEIKTAAALVQGPKILSSKV